MSLFIDFLRSLEKEILEKLLQGNILAFFNISKTIYDILKFIKAKLIENNLLKQDLIEYFDEKIKQYQLEFPKQTGGSADYKKKYHKYKDMYNSLLKKYNKLKSN
jgi:hypothetical protein